VEAAASYGSNVRVSVGFGGSATCRIGGSGTLLDSAVLLLPVREVGEALPALGANVVPDRLHGHQVGIVVIRPVEGATQSPRSASTRCSVITPIHEGLGER
jgi:hypothetical protein